MILNDKYFSLPPFISTSWDRVASLRFDGEMLMIDLTNGHSVPIPSVALKPELIELIFRAHASHLEKSKEHPSGLIEGLKFQVSSEKGSAGAGEFPLKLGINPLDGMGGSLQHNMEMANAPDLPKELVQKISSITKIVAAEEIKNFPKAEPHCNCFYCQIARHLHGQNVDEPEKEQKVEEEIVAETDLQFQQWQVQSIGNQQFMVTNKLDTDEHYNVYLGEPLGCTCGKSGCEHIVAVLKS